MSSKYDLIAIGEGLVELSTDVNLKDACSLLKNYGGDVMATAVSAKRLGSEVGFITKLGNDAFKDYLIQCWHDEGLDISNVTFSNEQNGLYLISKPNCNEKYYAYYRKKTAPAKLSVDDISETYISQAKSIYASGITQSLSLSAREAVLKAFKIAKNMQITTAYDPNYTPSIASLDDYKEWFEEILPYTDILFMSTKHDMDIIGITSIDASIKYLLDKGVKIVIIKSSSDKGYYLGYSGNISFIEFYTTDVCDTTSSGDAFNGGFLHAITHGLNNIQATQLASIVAGLQAKGIGAIKSIPYSDSVYTVFKGDNQ